MRLLRFLAPMLVLGMVASSAQAQSGAPPGWEFSLTPYAWLPAIRGNLHTPLPRVGEQGFGIGSGTLITDLDALPAMITGEARYGRFSLLGDFFYAALAQDLNTRDLLWQGGHSRVTSSVGTLLGMFRVLEASQQSLDVGAGTRIWGFTSKVSLNPGLEPGVIRKASLNWADPLVGARYHAMLSPRFGVTAYADVGGFNTGSRLTWQAIGSLDYDLTNWATLRTGWRYLKVDKWNAGGSVGLDLGFNGPFFAATFRF
jgi:hypothetical protein